MKSAAIKNAQELKQEIYRLRQLGQEQQAALAARFSGPSAIFVTARSLFSGTEAKKDEGHRDYVSLISRFLIPLALNKTLFRHSNFLVKLLVGMGAQKASGFVTESALTKAAGSGKAWLAHLFHKNKNEGKPTHE